MKILFALIALGYARREKKKSSTEILYGKIKLLRPKWGFLIFDHGLTGRQFHYYFFYRSLSTYFQCIFSELLQTDYDKNIRPYYLIKPVDISIDIFMNSFGSGSLTDSVFYDSVSEFVDICFS